MKFFKTVNLKIAEELLKNLSEHMQEVERVGLIESIDRITSKPVKSPVDLPSYNRSTVDGYAVISKDCQLANETFPTLLKIVGEVKMGEIYKGDLHRGEGTYIPTGGMVPEGSDSVVMVEYCDKLGEEILINRGAGKFENIIKKGEEIRAEEVVVGKDVKITPYHVGVLASMGISQVEVYRKMMFSVISTGDEIIDLEESYEPGKIFDINSYAIHAYLKKNGGEVVFSSLVKDSREELEKSIKNGLEISDVVLISGGSSVGTRDFTSEVIEKVGGKILIHGIEIKPGKPTIIAQVGDKIVIGLPGHPQSAMNVLRVVVKALGISHERKIFGKLLENISGEPGKDVFINVKIQERDGEVFIEPILSKSSMIRPLMESDGYIVIPSSCEGLYLGQKIEVIING